MGFDPVGGPEPALVGGRSTRPLGLVGLVSDFFGGVLLGRLVRGLLFGGLVFDFLGSFGLVLGGIRFGGFFGLCGDGCCCCCWWY